MEVFKVNFKSHFRHLWMLIFLLVLLPIGLHFLMVLRYGEYDHEEFLVVGVVVFGLFLLPMIILHFNYYIYSKDNYFSYDEKQGLMVYGKGGTETRFNVKDIEYIVCCKSWPMAENRTPIFPWDLYNYGAIKLKDGNLIKVSSLVVYEFEKKIKIDGIEMKIKKSFYPWIR